MEFKGCLIWFQWYTYIYKYIKHNLPVDRSRNGPEMHEYHRRYKFA